MEAPITVASVPAGHPYPRHVLAPPGEVDEVVHLPDPPVHGAGPGVWWPPAVLDAGWLSRHADRVDVVHVHFGVESLPAGRLVPALDALRRSRTALVFTVHDLTNPQLHDQERHDTDTGLLVEAADALITLTPGAAGAVSRRWGRLPTVVPHPHVLPLDASWPRPGRTDDSSLLVGVQLRDLRPNVDGIGTVRLLVETVARLRARGAPVRGRVDLHHQVRDEAQAAAVVEVTKASADVELRRTARLGDEALHESLSDLDLCLLPYRFGTHSGWLELCWDLGVPCAAPRGVGFYAEQHAGLLEFPRGDAAGLSERLIERHAELVRGRRARRAVQQRRRAFRRRQRREVARAHRAIYDAARGRPGG